MLTASKTSSPGGLLDYLTTLFHHQRLWSVE